ncbi:CubicO group peptidase (beta-lactamase class C family) [Mucilaginibacter frigoritolerans]|uniref:CubicO group peptidase (Beta-lactamase class C family) n=2 Tax=Mucilaginibacter frigoritolerans TaxID=652788 RepID=A0A562UC30_9SPHI|nr:CubicO group peptidase (beta-lactamase class C family) [Mucilaginibacter frigoritolerans]
MMTFTRHVAVFTLLLLSATVLNLKAQNISPDQLKQLVDRSMRTFNVPGIAVTIVKNGQVVSDRGYGVRSITSGAPVDSNTLFGIASNSKAFTTAALGILVNEGKLRWDDKLIKYIPEFKMYDDYVTKEFTVRDLLTHRSGLGLGAGDLMHTPDSNSFTIKDIIYSLRFIKPETSFRSRYAYDNIFYLVSAELITRLSGMSWGDFIQERIMRPLQMSNSGASYKRVKQTPDIIDGHVEINGREVTTSPGTDSELDAGAGGIYSSAADMGRWMLMQLNNGRYGPDLKQKLFSEAVHKEMWTPQVIIPVSKGGIYNTHFGAYGLGWFLTDVKGYEMVSHTGEDDGMISQVTLFPELDLGITVLSNKDGGGAVRAITDQLTDYYLGIKGIDRIQQWADKVKQYTSNGDRVTDSVFSEAKHRQALASKKENYSKYVGKYRDPWFGDVLITLKNHQLWFSSVRSQQLRGFMIPYKAGTFVVRWINPEIKADAFMIFDREMAGKATHIALKRVSPASSAAYDFQDLDLNRTQ